ncbi:uncharacterized protein Dmoj_GI22282 [Drosophila mojavensis]|uniref:Uncharacterized protein n=1 Tax=Drosophila mojavensis TaxID=7230 RepID=B4K727_DROMO|nr:uncharacterized protein Dmoj_GI22282 [Drosophila mojavensis]
MCFNSHTWLLSSAVLCCLSTIGAQQLFEQPSTLTARNLAPTIYNVTGGAGAGAAQLPNRAAAQRAPTQIIKATALQEVRDSEELAPFFQQLLKQTMPNWQTEHKQRGQQQEQQQESRGQQQQQQHFFVELPSQQPQILQGYNGVNVRQQQQQQQQQQQLQSTSLPQQQQQQQQQPFTQLPIHSPQAQNTTLGQEQCELCCDPLAPPNTPCGCCNTKPLLSAAALKATTG